MKKVLLGIGSNLGHRASNFNQAIKKLQGLGKVSATSFIYETAPLYETKQPSFLNAALLLETNLSPEQILKHCQDIEKVKKKTAFP